MAQYKVIRGKRYKAWGFRFNKKEADSLARSLRKDSKSVYVRKEENKLGHIIYVVYFHEK